MKKIKPKYLLMFTFAVLCLFTMPFGVLAGDDDTTIEPISSENNGGASQGNSWKGVVYSSSYPYGYRIYITDDSGEVLTENGKRLFVNILNNVGSTKKYLNGKTRLEVLKDGSVSLIDSMSFNQQESFNNILSGLSPNFQSVLRSKLNCYDDPCTIKNASGDIASPDEAKLVLNNLGSSWGISDTLGNYLVNKMTANSDKHYFLVAEPIFSLKENGGAGVVTGTATELLYWASGTNGTGGADSKAETDTYKPNGQNRTFLCRMLNSHLVDKKDGAGFTTYKYDSTWANFCSGDFYKKKWDGTLLSYVNSAYFLAARNSSAKYGIGTDVWDLTSMFKSAVVCPDSIEVKCNPDHPMFSECCKCSEVIGSSYKDNAKTIDEMKGQGYLNYPNSCSFPSNCPEKDKEQFCDPTGIYWDKTNNKPICGCTCDSAKTFLNKNGNPSNKYKKLISYVQTLNKGKYKNFPDSCSIETCPSDVDDNVLCDPNKQYLKKNCCSCQQAIDTTHKNYTSVISFFKAKGYDQFPSSCAPKDSCDYELTTVIPTSCDISNSGKVTDKAKWDCIFKSTSASDSTVKTEYVSSWEGNDFCKFFCTEEIRWQLPNSGSYTYPGRYLSVGDSSGALSIGPVKYIGKKTCRLTDKNGSTTGKINYEEWEKQFKKANEDMVEAWDNYQIALIKADVVNKVNRAAENNGYPGVSESTTWGTHRKEGCDDQYVTFTYSTKEYDYVPAVKCEEKNKSSDENAMKAADDCVPKAGYFPENPTRTPYIPPVSGRYNTYSYDYNYSVEYNKCGNHNGTTYSDGYYAGTKTVKRCIETRGTCYDDHYEHNDEKSYRLVTYKLCVPEYDGVKVDLKAGSNCYTSQSSPDCNQHLRRAAGVETNTLKTKYEKLRDKRDALLDQIIKCNNYVEYYSEFNPSVSITYPDAMYGNSYTLKATKYATSSTNYYLSGDSTSDTAVPASSYTNYVSGHEEAKYGFESGNRGGTEFFKEYYNCDDHPGETCKMVGINYPRNLWVETTTSVTYAYSLPDNVYRYILKPSGESVSAKPTTGNYLDIGFSNLPIHYSVSNGDYDYQIITTSFGSNDKLNKYIFENKTFNKQVYDLRNTGFKYTYGCHYKVKPPDIICQTGEPACPRPPSGTNIIYRTISLTNPFPYEDGKGRTPGYNWRGYESYSTGDSIVEAYITNNRGVKEYNIYHLDPMFEIDLTPALMKTIKDYNSEKNRTLGYFYNKQSALGYSDFSLTCYNPYTNDSSQMCKSDIIREWGVKGCAIDETGYSNCGTKTEAWGG